MPDSSPETAEAVEAEDQGVTTAEAPAAEGEKETVLDAVKASLEPSEEAPASVETGKDTTGAESKETDEGDGEQAEDPLQLTEAEEKVLSQRAKDRFHSLAQRAKDAEAKTEALTPKAEQFEKLTGYLRQNSISNEEFNNTVEVTRLIKSDPNKAFDLVLNVLQNLAQQTGRALSTDLQERIRLGHISEEDARKLSQAEARAKLVEEQTQAQRQATEQAEQQSQWETQVSAATEAVDAWAKTQAANDPDWSLKMPHMTRALELELQRGGVKGYPQTKADAVALAEKVKKQVETDLKPFRTKPQPKTPSPNDGSSPLGDAEPKTAVEAAHMALAKLKG